MLVSFSHRSNTYSSSLIYEGNENRKIVRPQMVIRPRINSCDSVEMSTMYTARAKCSNNSHAEGEAR